MAEWKYAKPLDDGNAVRDFACSHTCELPESLIDHLTRNNGGRPADPLFDTVASSGRVFKCMLSYNPSDKENIFELYPALYGHDDLYPIGLDSAGNFVCWDTVNYRYALLDHEADIAEEIVQASNKSIFV